MISDLDTWIFVALFCGGAVVAIIVFLRTTPREFWFRHPPQMSLEEKLKQLPASAQAVIIKGNKKRAIVSSLPFFFALGIFFGMSWWAKNTKNIECENIFGVNAAHVMLLLFVYGIPIFFFSLALFFSFKGYKIIKYGYAPPLDTAAFHDVISKKGRSSIVSGIVLVLFPFLSLPFLYLGHTAYTELSKGAGFQGLESYISAKCK